MKTIKYTLFSMIAAAGMVSAISSCNKDSLTPNQNTALTSNQKTLIQSDVVVKSGLSDRFLYSRFV